MSTLTGTRTGMFSMTNRCRMFLICFILIQTTAGYIIPSEDEPDCPGIKCTEYGYLMTETCTCTCDNEHTGVLCETELQQTAWPRGRYSLLSSVFGCPEPDEYGWYRGYINLTLSNSRPAQKWKIPFVASSTTVQNTADPHILGPYHYHALQLNFCTRLDTDVITHAVPITSKWPPGNYCVFNAGNSCPEGFSENSVTIAGYHVTWSDTDGVLPNVTLDSNSSTLTLAYCCRDKGGDNNDALDLPNEFPFLLLKKNGSACSPITQMEVSEERFDMVDDLDQFQFEGQNSNFVRIGEHRRLGLCYYAITTVQECFHPWDLGFSYMGTVNVTKDGLPCMNWYDVDPKYKPGKNWVGDGFTENHCRYPNWFPPDVPYCYVNTTNGAFEPHMCNITECELDLMLEEVGTFKPVYGSNHMTDRQPENAVNGIQFGFPFQSQRPMKKPWLQIDLEETFLVHGVKIWRTYVWFPVNFRFVGVHVSQQRWDFINYGALQCNERRNPRKSRYYQLMCIRPIQGQYVTIRNFDNPDPEYTWGNYFFLEISEVSVIIKRSMCVRRLGLLSGEVRDFQLSGSGDAKDTMFERGRLLIPGSGWCVDRIVDPYFMVDLIVPTVVSGLEIQGWIDGQDVINVDEFILEFGVNQEALYPFLAPQGHIKVFRIDTDLSPGMIKRILFVQPRLTRYLRLNIIKYSGRPCLKMELLGCPKRASRDLFCVAGTHFFGYEVIERSAFWMETDEVLDVNQTTCSQLCASHHDCLCHFFKPGKCIFFKSTRYNPHYNHWFIRKLDDIDTLFTKLCIKDIKDTRTCGWTIIEATVLESPSYPFYYGQMVHCIWRIDFSTRQAYARIEIKEVNLATADSSALLRQNGVFDISPGQCVDTMTIDGVIITSENEHEYRRAVIVSRESQTEIVLTSCARYSLADVRGFRLDISYSDAPGCRSSDVDCVAWCKPPAAIITSPAYPTGLKPATSCRWSIRGELGQFVSLTFKVIDIRSSTPTCENAFVTVFDESLFGGEQSALERYCSYNMPVGDVHSSWQFMHVHLLLGDGVVGNGFMAEYSLVDYVKQTENSTSNDIAGCMGWKEYEDNCYQVFDEPEGLTWIAAESICQDNYGHLVSLASPQEANFIHSLLTTELLPTNITDPAFYIGLRKLGNGERYVNYKWTDGSPLTYTAWFKNETSGQSQPDGLENERCTQLSMYSIHSLRNWHDVACAYDKTRLFICEKSRLTFDVGWKHLDLVFPWQPRLSNATQSLNLFTCNESKILAMYLCDGHKDCADGSDENMCEEGCFDGFTCDNDQCITAARYCDFRKDCDDGSDENQCVLAECLPSEWRCSSGQCISKGFRCDVKADCFDGSDEENCDTCQPSSFQCYDQRCVASSRVCDTYHDCSGRFNEDESQGCMSSSQESCADWYTIGHRESGPYLIDLGAQDSFEVECKFIETGDNRAMVQTILHHEFEATMTWISGFVDVKPRYSALHEQIRALKNHSTVCKQFLALDCSYVTSNSFIVYGDADMTMDSFMVNSNCGCPYVGNCGEPIRKCNCSAVEHSEWYGNDHNVFRTDSGFITNQQFLPVQWLVSLDIGTSFSPAYRTTLGPLVCEEEIIGSEISDKLLCDNNQLANKDTKCILDFDIFGEIKGCRDLSHIETCGTVPCPEYSARCPDGHCLPFYRICDGIKQCSGGEDEMYCDSNTACVGNLKCRESYVCVPMINVCDGVPHCPLGDDERFCNEPCIDGCSCNEDSMMCTMSVYANVSESNSLERYRSLRKLFLGGSFDHVVLNESAFYYFPYLIHLTMSRSQVKLLSPYQFENNRNLITLDISENHISVLYPNTFYGLGKLKILRLIGNPLSEIQPYAFSGLGRLPVLDLVGFSIEGLTVGMFDGLSMLEMLNLTNSRLVSVESNTFADLNALKSLDLRGNNIKDFEKGIFEGLLVLKDLYTSDFAFCCLRPKSVIEEHCMPSKDEFSSCDDLMRNQVLRAFLWIIGGLALLGNIGVLIYRFVVDRQSLSKTYGLFVTNLGMADFLMGVYLMILAIADTEFRGSYVWNDHHWRNGAACKIAGILSTLGSEGSVIFLCFITLDRLLVVKFPFGNVRISRKACIALCFCAWFFILTLALVPLKTGDYFQGTFYSRSAVCLALPLTRDRPAGWEYSIAVFIVFNLSAFILIAIAQIIIYREIVVSRGKLASKGRRNDMTVARNLFLVAITDFLCWFPVGVMGVMALSDHVISGEVYAWIAVFVLPINSALNPFIYTIGATISKARTTRRSTVRQYVSKGSSDITKVFTKRSFHFGRNTMLDKQTLVDLTLRRIVTPKETLSVALRVAKCIHTLHIVDLVHGNLSIDKIYLKDTATGISNVAVMIFPKLCQTEEDLTDDIKAYGEVMKHMLNS